MTAVEYLEEKLKGEIGLKDLISIKQAKELEKQQIIDAWNNGYDELDRASCTSIKYYNETFNK